ncbi:hypothetical protein [Ornithinicoccus halotolerans]|uniref:hypothetical protein n=1 Tax=Ornithinicoccus halotolerans TaxID=1748220 RepID=UPI001885FE37|nr:hypothetical protein [Ornithinicoccus halotolerans]
MGSSAGSVLPVTDQVRGQVRVKLGLEPSLDWTLSRMMPRAERLWQHVEASVEGGLPAVPVPTGLAVRIPEPTAAAAGNMLLALHERWILAQALAVLNEPPDPDVPDDPDTELYQALQDRRVRAMPLSAALRELTPVAYGLEVESASHGSELRALLGIQVNVHTDSAGHAPPSHPAKPPGRVRKALVALASVAGLWLGDFSAGVAADAVHDWRQQQTSQQQETSQEQDIVPKEAQKGMHQVPDGTSCEPRYDEGPRSAPA